jgi:[lysine-biosynthesis-protein LysW]--L-2-aminoadipate ligase
MRFGLVACRPTPTNDELAAAGLGDLRWEPMTPHVALEVLRAGDVALGRLDVLPTLDGMDDGLWALGALAARGVVVLNDPAALLAAHDKLLTARLLRRHGIPHPHTWHVRRENAAPRWGRSVVVKPRFGSWGREVYRCDDPEALQTVLARARGAGWYRRHGALVQELVPPQGYDLRVVVAGGRVVGATFRIAAPGEWRTNVALGGVRREVSEPPRDAAALALEAAGAIGASLVGVDLLPDSRGGWVVAELNGAVEFTHEYAPWHDVFVETASAVAREGFERAGYAALLEAAGLA